MHPICPPGDTSDHALLRLILLCEFMYTDAATLVTITGVLEHLGLIDLTGVDEEHATTTFQRPPHLRLVEPTPDRRYR